MKKFDIVYSKIADNDFQNLSDGFMVTVYSDKVIGNVPLNVTKDVTKESK